MAGVAVDEELFGRELAVKDHFVIPTIADWRRLAERSLRGVPLDALVTTTHESISIKPLYTVEDTRDPRTESTRVSPRTARAWGVCQQVRHPDPTEVARGVEEDADRGVGSAWLIFDRTARLGLDPDQHERAAESSDGVIIATAEDAGQLLEGIDPARTAIHLHGGGNGLGLGAAVLAAARRRGADHRAISGTLDLDPLGALAADGELPYGLERSLALLADAAAWTTKNSPGMRALAVSSLPYRLAGATAVQELAFCLATAVEYLRSLDRTGTEIDSASGQLRFLMAVGRDLFMEAAKLRAARRLWARVVEACGGSAEARRAEIHAVTSPRSLAARDVWVNSLRTTVESFAAVVGGADTLTVLPFDSPFGSFDALARRLAATSHAILREESHLHRVADPAAGSWYVEQLTDQLCRSAWQRFREIEAQGGMATALTSGAIHGELEQMLSTKRHAIATRQDPVTGVSTFPNLDEEPLQRRAPDASSVRARSCQAVASRRPPRAELERLRKALEDAPGDGSVMDAAIDAFDAGATLAEVAAVLRTGGEPTRIPPLPSEREAEIFERLQDAADAWLENHGHRPRAFLALMGPPSEHRVQAEIARNVLAAGGIETVADGGFEGVAEAARGFTASGASVAVICASEQRSEEVVPALAQLLKTRGALQVLVVARPDDREGTWREAGVDGFLCEDCDVHAVLRDLLTSEGWRP
jgi:methylmalonyl-CoA mutase